MLYTYDGDAVFQLNLETGLAKEFEQLPSGWDVRAMAVNPVSRNLFALIQYSLDTSILEYDTMTGEALSTFDLPYNNFDEQVLLITNSMAFQSNGDLFLS